MTKIAQISRKQIVSNSNKIINNQSQFWNPLTSMRYENLNYKAIYAIHDLCQQI
jgi:hypothetical protein